MGVNNFFEKINSFIYIYIYIQCNLVKQAKQAFHLKISFRTSERISQCLQF